MSLYKPSQKLQKPKNSSPTLLQGPAAEALLLKRTDSSGLFGGVVSDTPSFGLRVFRLRLCSSNSGFLCLGLGVLLRGFNLSAFRVSSKLGHRARYFVGGSLPSTRDWLKSSSAGHRIGHPISPCSTPSTLHGLKEMPGFSWGIIGLSWSPASKRSVDPRLGQLLRLEDAEV